MSAQLSIHRVKACLDFRTTPICGEPCLCFKVENVDGETTEITVFMCSEEAGVAVGAALIQAGTDLIRRHGVESAPVAAA